MLLLTKDLDEGEQWIEVSAEISDFFFFLPNISQVSLFNVLKAYSLYDKEVGYCQGMSDMAAFILMNVSEEARKNFFFPNLLCWFFFRDDIGNFLDVSGSPERHQIQFAWQIFEWISSFISKFLDLGTNSTKERTSSMETPSKPNLLWVLPLVIMTLLFLEQVWNYYSILCLPLVSTSILGCTAFSFDFASVGHFFVEGLWYRLYCCPNLDSPFLW